MNRRNKLLLFMLVSSDFDSDPRVQKEAWSAHRIGHYVTVFCRSADNHYPFKVVPVNITRVEGSLAKLVERFSFFIKILTKRIKDRPDIIHANDLDMLPLGWLMSKKLKSKLVYDAHELWTDANRNVNPIIVKFAYYFERFFSRRADATVAVSNLRAEAMAEILNIEKPFVVMNSPMYQKTDHLKAPMDLHKTLNLPENTKIVLHQGRYVAGRGIEESILSAKYLPDNIVLVFRGYGPIEDKLKQLLADEGLTEKVYFVPPVPMTELVNYAIGADLGLVLYKPVNKNNLYAAPNKLFEYMMAGVPIAGADIPYLKEIVLPLQIGKLFNPSDPKDVANTIIGLLSNEKELANMKKRTLKAAINYCWEAEYDKLENIYQTITI